MFKTAVWRGRSERWAEAYFLPYVEALSDARTKPTAVFNILLRLAEGAAPLISWSCLFHGGECSFLIRVIVPATPPIVSRGLRGGHFGATIPVQRHPIDRVGDVNPIRHG